mmetsp:Transcript_2044/g.5084  ORF Transcript_2044/g.5084 Transcript_2044/m.5084 type:complete len:256 (-) Transcript_2044:1012-1779(-)
MRCPPLAPGLPDAWDERRHPLRPIALTACFCLCRRRRHVDAERKRPVVKTRVWQRLVVRDRQVHGAADTREQVELGYAGSGVSDFKECGRTARYRVRKLTVLVARVMAAQKRDDLCGIDDRLNKALFAAAERRAAHCVGGTHSLVLLGGLRKHGQRVRQRRVDGAPRRVRTPTSTVDCRRRRQRRGRTRQVHHSRVFFALKSSGLGGPGLRAPWQLWTPGSRPLPPPRAPGPPPSELRRAPCARSPPWWPSPFAS